MFYLAVNKIKKGTIKFNSAVLPQYVLPSMQYTEIFLTLKIENFQLKNSDIFLIFAQNIDCGYTLEPPR